MNILITGGLLGLAVVAILGSILLGMDEKRAAKAPKDNISGNINPPANALPPRQSQALKQPDRVATIPPTPAMTPPIPATPVLSQSTDKLPTLKRREAQATNLADLDGQVQEIAGEVRALARHAGELEQRLNHLGELLEHTQQRPPRPSGQLYLPEADTQTL